MSLSLRQIQFCAEECARQQSGERSVANMCRAWHYCQDHGNYFYHRMTLHEDFQVLVLHLAKLVEPALNLGYRQTPVSFKNGSVLSAENISHQMSSLAIHAGKITPQHLYHEFQEIHPFNDGNGRIGKILFNLRNKSMHKPVWPQEPVFDLRIH